MQHFLIAYELVEALSQNGRNFLFNIYDFFKVGWLDDIGGRYGPLLHYVLCRLSGSRGIENPFDITDGVPGMSRVVFRRGCEHSEREEGCEVKYPHFLGTKYVQI